MNTKTFLSEFDWTGNTDWTKRFSDFDIKKFQHLLQKSDEAFWQKAGERRALRLFHEASIRVPAYQDFLKKHHVRAKTIKTISDFKNVPLLSKENYIRAYPLKERCWDGKLASSKLAAMSSGTNGEPTFWPRAGFQEFEAAITHELLYRTFFEIDKYKTLLVIGFPMGVYVSGIATLLPSWLVALKRYDLTVVPAGTSKQEILRVTQHLSQQYDQVILVGHPFFMKDVVESGAEAGIRWSKTRLRMMFCSEGFSEEWREYVLRQIHTRINPSHIISTYGSSELLLMAYETPASIAIKKKTGENLFQYNPLFRYIESVNGELAFTAVSGTPLIRYNLHDAGRVYSFAEIHKQFPKQKIEWRLPFLALGGRSDYAIVFYAANIYPEHVRQALDHKPFLDKITGKFTMRKGYTKKMEEFLEINIELRKGVISNPTFQKEIQLHIFDYLQGANMEYFDMSSRHVGKRRAMPHIKLWPYQHEKYFKPGLKPRYIAQE